MASADEHVDQEKQEVFLVEETDTVVDPRAVMVHSGNAVLADGAVMAAGRLHRVALLALL